MLTLKSQTCCFTGHRKLPREHMASIVKRLNLVVDALIGQGVTDFISGGALGFDQIAASLIAAKKEMGHPIKLVLALPYSNQDEGWTTAQKKLYRQLLTEADEIVYVSETYRDGCVKKQNRYMVDRSAHCICARLYPSGGIDQTIAYAKQKGLRIVHVALSMV